MKKHINIICIALAIYCVNVYTVRSMWYLKADYLRVPGCNNLIRKAIAAEGFKDWILKEIPAMKPHSTISLKQYVELGDFGGKYGLCIWYGDSTLDIEIANQENKTQ